MNSPSSPEPGAVLASRLLGHRIVGYVERGSYCCRVLAQRIKEGFLDEAPIFGDVRAFVRDGYAASYQGLVDVVSGGFPCNPTASPASAAEPQTSGACGPPLRMSSPPSDPATSSPRTSPDSWEFRWRS